MRIDTCPSRMQSRQDESGPASRGLRSGTPRVRPAMDRRRRGQSRWSLDEAGGKPGAEEPAVLPAGALRNSVAPRSLRTLRAAASTSTPKPFSGLSRPAAQRSHWAGHPVLRVAGTSPPAAGGTRVRRSTKRSAAHGIANDLSPWRLARRPDGPFFAWPSETQTTLSMRRSKRRSSASKSRTRRLSAVQPCETETIGNAQPLRGNAGPRRLALYPWQHSRRGLHAPQQRQQFPQGGEHARRIVPQRVRFPSLAGRPC